MRSIFSLSDAGHPLMLILLFLALLFQLFVFCIGCFYRAKLDTLQNVIRTGGDILFIA